MPAFVSPLIDPAAWTYSIREITIAAGLRYAGYTVRALRATRTAGTNIVTPTLGVLRRVTGTDGQEYVEVQTDPFPIRDVIGALSGGLPTFYLVFPNATGLTAVDGQIAPASDVLRGSGTDVTIAVVFQDRVTRDPALWASQILAAMIANAGNSTLWQPFADAVNAQTNSSNHAPVLLLDQTGEPVRSGDVDLIFGAGQIRRVTMAPADRGDLQQTVVRLNPADPGLWSGGTTSFRIRPVKAADHEFQLALIESTNRTGEINEITVTPSAHHVLSTDITSWFAPQFAIPTGQAASPLARFTRGNQVTHFPNGFEYFDDLFQHLHEAQNSNGRFDSVTGWAMYPTAVLRKRRAGEPDSMPETLKEASEKMAAAQGSSRYLAARFIQLEEGGEVEAVEVMAFHFIVIGLLSLDALGVSFARTDAAGAVILVGLSFANALLVQKLFATGGAGLEPSKDGIDVLDPIAKTVCVFSPFPSTVADNTAVAQPVSGFPFNTLFKIVRHFGLYHQKFGIVRTDAMNHVGYCGGMDLNPNRLDNEDRLARGPYYDVQSKVQGRAVRDLSISFNQRWERDGQLENGTALEFPPPSADSLGDPGTDIVQIARTYFRPQDPSRALAFAPQGDQTIVSTMLAGIRQAKEFIFIADQYLTPPDVYLNAVVQKVASGQLKKLVIAVPSGNDQPFGEIRRNEFINALRVADNGRGIVHVGYPRRRFTVSDNDLRSSSGKCSLGELLPLTPGLNPTVVLTPAARAPKVPFWLAVEGELMWVYDEAPGAPSGSKRFKVVRGADTKFIKGGTSPEGTTTRQHASGVPATVVDFAGIYVHAKVLLVDDVFIGVGSANVNRRGFFHDGEIHLFTVPQSLRAAPNNPIAALRRRMWADLLDIPSTLAGPLMDDPVAAANLFTRSAFLGNRFTDVDAVPDHLLFDASTGDSLITTLLQGFVFGVGAIDHVKLFNAIVDPSSQTESTVS
jgi:phosphatidylserine/phosphatidylglycerophosphate/cardiolipin synthase-like enzyme